MTPTNEVLLEKIENLTEKIDKGFDGVHTRQDKTNGKVIANTEWRIQQEALAEKRKKDWDNLKLILGLVGAGTLVNVIKVFTNFL